MRYLTLLLVIVTLQGCATEQSVVMPQLLRSSVRQEPTAVLFSDDAGEIRYSTGRFNVPGASRLDRTASYIGIWDPGRDLTALHASELRKLGVQASSVYEHCTREELASFTRTGRDSRHKSYETRPVLSPELADILLGKGQRWLLWITWSGLRFFHSPLPITGVEEISSSYWLFDLRSRALVWSGGLDDVRDSSLKYADAGAALEGEDFAGFRRLVQERTLLSYRLEDDSVPWLLGLLPH